jgi:serine/threonine-protein kinase RsbW
MSTERPLTDNTPRRHLIAVPNDMDELPKIAAFLEAAMADNDVPPNAQFDVNVAVDEACTNVIEHAYPAGESGVVEVACWRDGARWVVTVKDYVHSFDPTTAPTPDTTADLDHRRPGGLGIHFMRTLMDELRYEAGDGFEILTMVKHL